MTAVVEADATPLGGAGGRAGSMPFIGRAVEIGPDSLVVERVLDLREDLHLADHAFVHAPGVKPLSGCLPVLPMTMSLEAMAEVAACLAPGLGLIRIEKVKASRWIELADIDRLTLRISATRVETEVATGAQRIDAAIHPQGQDGPAISAAIWFGPRYQARVSLSPKVFVNPYRLPLSGEEIYRRRHLFHGPSYQCLTGDIILADASAYCEMVAPSPAGLFLDNAEPQLLLDPQLLDALGQLVGIWAMERERYVFPIGVGALEIYGPSPPPGSRVAARAEITADTGKTLEADIEVWRAEGVWMRVKAWRMWKFRWDRRLVNYRRAPTREALSQSYPADKTGACRMIDASDFTAADVEFIARSYLHMDEMSAFREKAEAPQRQRQWLLGRIAAKDAIRSLLAASSDGLHDIHPASLRIVHDEKRRPLVLPETLPRGCAVPHISITHCGSRAIALADAVAVGVDLEQIATRDAAFIDAAFTPAERVLLEDVAAGSGPALDEWVTRIWCAKEAVHKLHGGAIVGGPRRLEAVSLSPDGVVGIRMTGETSISRVTTQRDGGDIFARA